MKPLYPQTTVTDQGRELMAHMMAEKTKQMKKRAECKRRGDCPELLDRDSEGAAQCVEGTTQHP